MRPMLTVTTVWNTGETGDKITNEITRLPILGEKNNRKANRKNFIYLKLFNKLVMNLSSQG